MDDKLTKLDVLITKKMDINMTDCGKAVRLIYDIFTENRDSLWLSNYLIKAGGKVCGAFISTHYSQFDSETKATVINNIANGITNNASTFVTGCCGIASVIETDPSGSEFVVILRKILNFSQSKEAGSFNENKAKPFKAYVIGKLKRKFFSLDFSIMKKWEIDLLYSFLQFTFKGDTPEYFLEWIKKYCGVENAEQQKVETVSSTHTQPEPSAEMNKKVVEEQTETSHFKQSEQQAEKVTCDTAHYEASAADLLKAIDAASTEIKKLYSNAFVKNNAFKGLEDELSTKKEELITIKKEVEEYKQRASHYDSIIKSLEDRISKQAAEILDLTDRLRNFSSASEHSKRQEIEIFKSKIGSALRCEYEDFRDMTLDEYSESNYLAMKSIIDTVFKVLVRNDVIFR